jgi:UbiA prenyltransferase family
MPKASPPTFRTLLVLGRVSNLPTVWSNCLAGWMLGGGGSVARWWLLSLAASALYVGGMYLNDACDAAFDRQHRRERPIPSGAISVGLVWRLGGCLLASGWLILCCLGWSTAWIGTFLLVSILVYDFVHKAVSFSPILMALCRFFLFLSAASTGTDGVTGLAVWSAFALAGWIIGLSYLARRESTTNSLRHWPLAVLALPLVLAWIANGNETRLKALYLAVLLVVWSTWCLRHIWVDANRNLGLSVSGLLAGICVVDWLAVVPNYSLGAVFLGLFLAALAAQRLIPAT